MNPPAPVTATRRAVEATHARTYSRIRATTRRRPILAAPCARARPHRPRCARRSAPRAGAAARRRGRGAAAPPPAADPAPRSTTAAVAAGPLAIAVLRPRTPGSRRRPLHRSRCGRSRSPTSFPTTTPRRCARRLRIRYPIAADRVLGARRAAEPCACSARSAAPARVTALDRVALDRPLGLVLRAAPDAALRPGAPRRPLPARGAPDGGHLRPRLRALLRRPDRAAVVGLRAGLPRAPVERIAAEVAAEAAQAPAEVRRIMVDVGEGVWGPAWDRALRVARRQPVGGDAVASLRHLADGGAAAGRDRPGRRARSGPATRRRSASRSSTSASTTSPTCSPAPRWSRWSAAASRSPSRPSTAVNRVLQRLERLASGLGTPRCHRGICEDRSRMSRPASNDRESGGSRPGVAAADDAELDAGARRTRTRPRSRAFFEDPKRLAQTALVRRRDRGRDLLPVPAAGRPRGRAREARPGRPGLARGRVRSSASLMFASYVALFRGVVGERVQPDAGARATRSRWRGSRRRGCSRPAAPAASCSPTGRCARPACRARRRRRGWSPSWSSLYAVYMVDPGRQRDPAADRRLRRARAAGLTIVPAAIAGGVIVIFLLIALIPRRPRAPLLERLAGEASGAGRRAAWRPFPSTARRRDPRGDRLRPRALAGRPRDRRRDRLLGGADRHPLGRLPRLRRRGAAGRGRPGVLRRHVRQPDPAARRASAASTPA